MAQVHGPVPSVGDIWLELWASGFSLAQAGLLWTSVGVNQIE